MRDGQQATDDLAYARGIVVREAEDRFIQRRRAGEKHYDVARDMGISPTRAAIFEKAYRHQTTSHNIADSSSPKWFHDEIHTADVLSEGGYPALSESRWSGGKIAVCLPVLWPARSVAA